MSTLPPGIFSGFFEAPVGAPLTPTGNAKRSEVHNPYLTKDEFIETFEASAIGIDANSPAYSNGQLDKIILRASTYINTYCRQWFDVQTIDELHTGFTVKPFNPRLVTVYLRNSMINNIDTIFIQVLQFFIQVQTSPLVGSYLQIDPDWGVIHIVPLLSSAGAGAGVPIPAQILDKVPLGKLWVTYTFGYSTKLTDMLINEVAGASVHKVYQATDYNYRLWAPSQALNVYVNSVIQTTTSYKVDFANGMITFNNGLLGTDVVTIDATTYSSIPADIKQACILLTTKYITQATQNPARFNSLGITGYNVSFGKHEDSMEEIHELLKVHRRNNMTFI